MKSLKKIGIPLFMGGLSGLGLSSYTAYISPYLSSLGYSNSAISYMFALGPLATFFLLPAVGKVSDLIGRKKLIILSALLEILTLFYFINIPNSYILIALIITVETVAIHLLLLLAFSQMEDKVRDRERGTITGVYESVKNIGIVAGPIIGAFIISRYQISVLFKFAIIIFTLVILINLFIREKTQSNHYKLHLGDFNLIKEIKSFCENKSLWAVGILGIFANFAHLGSLLFLPLFVVQDLKAPLQYVGILISVKVAASLFQFVYGWLCDKRGCERYIIIGCTITAFSYILISQSYSIVALFISVVVYSIGSSIWNTSAVAHMSRIGEKEDKEGQIMGTYSAISSIGIFLSYIVSGTFVYFFGIRSLFILYSFLILAAILASKRYIFSKRIWNCGDPLFENPKS